VATTQRLRACAHKHRVSAFSITLAAFTAVLVPTGIGAASPTSHLTLAQAKAQIAALNEKAEAITEQYNSARDRLASLQKQARLTQQELQRDQAMLSKSESKLAAQAAAAYRTGGLDAAMSLVSSGSPQTFLNQTSTLQEVAHYQASQVAAANAAQRSMNATQTLRAAQVKQQRTLLADITAKRNSIANLLSQTKAVVNRLTTAAQAQYNAQANAVASRQLALRSSYTGPASGQAAAAVQYAYNQLGKPYYYGGAGPSSFDCSGLTMRAWEAAGVALSHNAAAQQSSIPSVSLSALQPGDLVFFGSPAHHVGIYIGGGRMIHAPHTGTVVQITSLSSYPPTTAGRP
jgi:cell wall-associated NlpC family hydrolase